MGRYCLLVLLLACPSALAQTRYTTLLGSHPTGVQRGRTTDILVYPFQGSLAGAYTLLFDGDPKDFKTEILSDGKQVPLSVRLTIAADARPGVREFRVATPQGVTSVAELVVGDHKGVLEVGPNDTPEKAQAVALPVTIYGRLDRPEKTGWYKFRVEAGDDVSFAVLCSRLQFKLYQARVDVDPMLILTDDKGRELASNDDYFNADPFLRYRFAKAGEYCIGIRDSQYRGSPPSPYRLTISRQPFVLNVYPLAVERGREVELRPTQAGDPPRALPAVQTRIPADWTPGRHQRSLEINGEKSNPVPILVTDLPTGPKRGPNNTAEKAQLLAVNSGINGCLDAPGDVDWYRFDARKGETYVLEVFARRYQSDLDSILSIHDAAGKQLAVNDDILERTPGIGMIIPGVDSDTRSKDSRIVWTAPADGVYQLRLTDVHGKGGPSFVYFLSCRVAVVQPDFVLRCDPGMANLGRGSSFTWHLHLERLHGFDGPVQVDVQGLPEGVTASRLSIAEKMNHGCLVLTAAADARVTAANVRVTGTATLKGGDGQKRTVVRFCQPTQEMYYFGAREVCLVNMHTVAVTTSSPLVVKPSLTEARLTPGGSVRIDFEVRRGPDIPADATLVFGYKTAKVGNGWAGADPLPPGLSADLGNSKVRLGPNETKGWIVLTAAPTTEPIAEIPFTLLTPEKGPRFPLLYSSPAIYLTVPRTEK
jgi:hypothetical protein